MAFLHRCLQPRKVKSWGNLQATVFGFLPRKLLRLNFISISSDNRIQLLNSELPWCRYTDEIEVDYVILYSPRKYVLRSAILQKTLIS